MYRSKRHEHMNLAADLQIYAPVAAAVSALLHPHAEVVLHDLRTSRIAGIWNSYSGRRVGGASLLDEEIGPGDAAVLGPYAKTGPRGERLKSVTAVLRGHDETPIGLLCVNLDVSRLDEASRILAMLVATQEEPPPMLFGRDWREQMQTALDAWLRDAGLNRSALKRNDRIALIGALDQQGLFETRHAADHAAELLGISRTSLYNYLRAARACRPSTGEALA